jgi:outer membrane receptor for ferrienterochelin and colicins
MIRRIFIFLFFSVAAWVTPCSAQDECGHNAVRLAEGNYDIGRFVECISGLKHCLDADGIKKVDDQIEAYELISKSYLAMDSTRSADEYIEKLLALNEDYQGQPHDPSRFRMQVALIRTQLRSSMTSSVSKRSESIDYAPATMQIITAEDIKQRGYQDLEAVFHDLPGFDITSSYGVSYSVMYMRGYRDAQYTERILVMVDGVEDNDIWSNAAFISKQYAITNVKRIEVIYGPASTIYGANAFCGVINIVTKDASDIFPVTEGSAAKKTYLGVDADAGYGSYNSRYIDGTATISNKDMALSITGRTYQSEGMDLSSEDPAYWSGTTNYTTANYQNALTIPYSADTFKKYHALDPNGQYYTVSADSTKIVPTAKAIAKADSLDKARYNSTPGYYNTGKFYTPIRDYYAAAKLSIGSLKFGLEYYDKNEGSAGDYIQNFVSPNYAYTNWEIRNFNIYSRYDKNLTNKIGYSTLTYYRYQDYGDNSRISQYNSYGGGELSPISLLSNKLPGFTTKNYYQASNQFGEEMKVNYKIDQHFNVLAGSEFRTGIYQGNYITSAISPAVVNGTISATPAGNSLTEYTMSGYVTGTYQNTEKRINIDLGGRLDHNRYRDTSGYGNMFNPRIAVVYYPGKFIFKLIYAEAFLDASDLNKFGTSTTRLLNNPALPPEKVKNFELSARYKFAKNTSLEVVGYRALYTNSIALDSAQTSTGVHTTQFRDIGESLVYGIQADLETQIIKSVKGYVNFTYTFPESEFLSAKGGDSLNERTGDIAYYTVNAGVNWSFLKKYNLNVRTNIVSSRPTGEGTSISTNPLTSIPGFAILNATFGYQINKTILLQAGCNNIFNTVYYSPGDRLADNVQYPSEVPQPLRNYYVKLRLNLKNYKQ